MPADPLAIDAGCMRNRITIQGQTQPLAQDSYGGALSTWQTVLTTWAYIATASSREVYQAAQFSAQVTHVVVIRWSPVPLSGGMQILFGTRTFQVQTVENVQERNIRMNLMCLEIDGVSS